MDRERQSKKGDIETELAERQSQRQRVRDMESEKAIKEIEKEEAERQIKEERESV